DVSSWRRRAEALDESEEKLRLALEASGMGLWSYDLVTGEATWDARMREIVGREGPLRLDEYLELVVPEDRPTIGDGMAALRRGAGTWQSPPHRIVCGDGELRWVSTSGRGVTDEAGRPVRLVGGLLDVTARQLADEQLRHTQRLEAV